MWILQTIRRLLPCRHRKTTWPMRLRTHDGKRKLKETIVCLDCTRKFAYDFEQMRITRVIRERTT